MKCPVCGEDCLKSASELIAIVPSVFAGCRDCKATILEKSAPPPPASYSAPCSCGKRFIDNVFAHLYAIFVREGYFTGKEALREVGTPLVHPGFPLSSPPFLPVHSLVLLSRKADRKLASLIVSEIPEIRAVVQYGNFTPGVIDPDLVSPPKTYDLLAGCDVRADIYPTSAGPIVLYQQQSKIHIEFPRPFNPKIDAVENRIRAIRPEWFVDAFSGIGKLGLTAARLGVPHVILNDAWYAAAFWSGYNIILNSEFFRVDKVEMNAEYRHLEEKQVGSDPELVAHAEGLQEISVFHGDFKKLHDVLPQSPVLAALDVFEKRDLKAAGSVLASWYELADGEAFIP